jgi:hypothetical protein
MQWSRDCFILLAEYCSLRWVWMAGGSRMAREEIVASLNNRGEVEAGRASSVSCVSKVKRTLTILAIGIYFAVLSGLSSGCSKAKGYLAFVGKPVASGSSFVFTLTNMSDSTVVYKACLPQTQSGGTWSNVQQSTNPTPLILLRPKQSCEVKIQAPISETPWRLPVLWGRAPALTAWQRIELAAQTIFTPHHRGLRLNLYTNFSAEISP